MTPFEGETSEVIRHTQTDLYQNRLVIKWFGRTQNSVGNVNKEKTKLINLPLGLLISQLRDINNCVFMSLKASFWLFGELKI